MSTLTFADDMARMQRALAQCHDMVVRRSAVLEALRLRTGERVLEVGCGGGFYAYESAQCVGATGRLCAIDLSADTEWQCYRYRTFETVVPSRNLNWIRTPASC